MKLHLVSVGQKMPAWVDMGYEEYAQRMPPELKLQAKDIALAKRTKTTDIRRAIDDEGQRMLDAIPKQAHVVALDVKGQSWSTEKLATQLESWMQLGQDVAFLVGGPDGLSDACMQRANQKWSLSALTYPHPLVRVILAEQLYRAWSVVNNHPYHRAG